MIRGYSFYMNLVPKPLQRVPCPRLNYILTDLLSNWGHIPATIGDRSWWAIKRCCWSLLSDLLQKLALSPHSLRWSDLILSLHPFETFLDIRLLFSNLLVLFVRLLFWLVLLLSWLILDNLSCLTLKDILVQTVRNNTQFPLWSWDLWLLLFFFRWSCWLCLRDGKARVQSGKGFNSDERLLLLKWSLSIKSKLGWFGLILMLFWGE